MRHANPWSGWTRLVSLPLLILAVWSRVWIGGFAVVPVAAVLVWIWVNPRLFPPPRSTRAWISRAVLGERVWINRRAVPVPTHHAVAPHLLSVVALLGAAVLIGGLVLLHPWLTALGFTLAFGAKLWFVDRMVWLHADMKDATPEYRSWLF
jgi:hypothetical protein